MDMTRWLVEANCALSRRLTDSLPLFVRTLTIWVKMGLTPEPCDKIQIPRLYGASEPNMSLLTFKAKQLDCCGGSY